MRRSTSIVRHRLAMRNIYQREIEHADFVMDKVWSKVREHFSKDLKVLEIDRRHASDR